MIDFFIPLMPEILILLLGLGIICFNLIFPKKDNFLIPISLISLIIIIICTFFAKIGPNSLSLLANIDFTITGEPYRQIFPSVAFLTIIISRNFLKTTKYKAEFLALILFATLGMMLVMQSMNLFFLFIGLELITITFYFLTAFNKKSMKSAEAGFKLFIQNAISSAVLLFGMSIFFNFTHTLNYVSFSPYLYSVDIEAIHYLAFILILAAFAFKIAIFPFQLWIPDVYEGSPTAITAFLSVGSMTAGLYALHTFLGYTNISLLFPAITVLAVLTMTFGNLAAFPQKNIKRLLAFSSIAQAGFILVLFIYPVIGKHELLTVKESVFLNTYIIAYIITNLLAFGTITVIYDKIKSHDLSKYKGLGKKLPFPAFLLTLSLLSLIGIPPLAVFYGKIGVFIHAVQEKQIFILFIAIINTAISAYYYLRVIKQMYLYKSKELSVKNKKIPLNLYDKFSLAILVIIFLIISIYYLPVYH